jgi:hypothetical protein
MTKLADPKIRLNNLYNISNSDGENITMKLTKSQRKVLEAFLANPYVIWLKSRQE